jgi:hypothetical protein
MLLAYLAARCQECARNTLSTSSFWTSPHEIEIPPNGGGYARFDNEQRGSRPTRPPHRREAYARLLRLWY